ncbi:MAG: glycosyltransferase [Crocinitomicaceae bacterium]|nr:glycosyltransferase [Flavobacteriales bacterium]NQZ38030.1 glycosyltransferase [Crocinitomicaceae bacterium]
MSFIIVIYLIVYGLIIGGVILGGFLLHLKKSKQKNAGSNILAQEITVLIPFRNEVERLDDLLTSILSSMKLPYKFIFIDDHSSDHSSKLIKDRLGDLPFEILTLSDDLSGKKQALRAAIDKCQTKYVLTLDADVSFRSSYFNSLEELDEADMYVLPAIMIGKSPIEWFYELDVVLANGLNTSLSGITRPIFSSGANFLFKKQVFDEVDDLESHVHMASGDDTYLLRDFRKNQKDIRLESNLNVAIWTDTPHSFKEFIDQRLRWVGKTTDIGDSLASVSAIGQFFFAIVFFGLLIYTAIIGNWFDFSILLTAKIGLDLMFFLPFFLRTKRFLTWCFIPIYEVAFPVYSLILGILMVTYRPKWKGRAIQSNNS